MTFSKTGKNIREFIFLKIIKLIVKNFFGHIGQKNNWSLILLVHTIQFLKNMSHFRKFKFFWESPLSDTFVGYFCKYGKYELQICLKILASISPWHVAFCEFKFMISRLISFSCNFIKSNLSETLLKLH